MVNPNIKDYGFGGKYSSKERDDAIRAKPRTRVWTKEKCIDELEDCLTLFKKILRTDEKINKGNPNKLKAESVRDLNNIMNRIMQFMQYLYPVVQKNVNLNIDVTTDAVMERLKNWKSEQVVDIVNPDAIVKITEGGER